MAFIIYRGSTLNFIYTTWLVKMTIFELFIALLNCETNSSIISHNLTVFTEINKWLIIYFVLENVAH
jgi:hypothetical protein